MFVCRLLQLLRDQRSASKSFYRLLVTFSWISIRGFAKKSFVLELWLVLLTLKAIAVSSDSCVANIALLFYLVVSSALER